MKRVVQCEVIPYFVSKNRYEEALDEVAYTLLKMIRQLNRPSHDSLSMGHDIQATLCRKNETDDGRIVL